MFKGLFTAFITPFNEDSSLDLASFRRLVEFQVSSGVDGVVVAGSTGEGTSLTNAELSQLLSIACEYRSEKFKIISSISTNNTVTTLEKLKVSEQFAIDGVMVIAPYYNKPKEEGILRHFKAISDASNHPIIAYNHPGRTGIDMSDELLVRLFRSTKVCCIKDATTNLDRPLNLHSSISDGDYENRIITQLSGDDSTSLAFNAMGGDGLISVASNTVPDVMRKIQDFTLKNDFTSALGLHKKYTPLFKALCSETNPTPIKYLAFKMGIIDSYHLRLPLCELSNDNKILIDQAIEKYNTHSKIDG